MKGNFVAKHARLVNRCQVFKDKTQYTRKTKHRKRDTE